MKKFLRMSATFVLLGALLASCIKNEPSSGIEEMRAAKADLIRANAEWVRSAAAVQNATAKLTEAQISAVEAANVMKMAEAKVKEAEAKIAEAQAALLQAQVEFQKLVNAAQEQQDSIAIAAAKAELQFKIDSLNAALEVLMAKKESDIAAWQAQKQENLNRLQDALNDAELAQKQHLADIMEWDTYLVLLKDRLAQMLEDAKYAKVNDYISKLSATSARVKEVLGLRRLELDKIAVYQAQLTVYMGVDAPAIEEQLAKDVADTKAWLDTVQDIEAFAKEMAEAQKTNQEAFNNLAKEIIAKVAELKRENDANQIKINTFLASDEYRALVLAQEDAQAAVTAWAAQEPNMADFVAPKFDNNIQIWDANAYGDTMEGMEEKVEDKLTQKHTVGDDEVFAAVVNGKYGFYKEIMKNGQKIVVRAGKQTLKMANTLLKETAENIKEGRILEYQGQINADVTYKSLKERSENANKRYEDAWKKWQKTYAEEGFKNGGGKFRQIWKDTVAAYHAALADSVNTYQAMKDAETAMKNAKKAWDAAEAERARYEALVDSIKNKAHQDLRDYEAALKGLITGTGFEQDGQWSNWLTSVKISELLGGITFSPEQLLKLFMGSANYEKIEQIVNYLVNQDNAGKQLIQSARSFKAIIDGNLENGGFPGYFKMQEIYNGYKAPQPVIACTSIYAYHAWFILYIMFEGNNVTIGNGIFSTGLYASAPDQLMLHFLNYNAANYATFKAAKGNKVKDVMDAEAFYWGAPGDEHYQHAGKVGEYEAAVAAHEAQLAVVARLKAACTTAREKWAAQITGLTTLEAKMFGAQYTCKWEAVYGAGKDTVDPDVQNARVRKAASQPNEFYFYLEHEQFNANVYPSLVNDRPIYWTAVELFVHNVGLPEQNKYYECPDFTTDFRMYDETDITNAVNTGEPYYPAARGLERKFYNYEFVYNHQDEYQTLYDWIMGKDDVMGQIAANNKANNDAYQAHVDAFKAKHDAWKVKMDELNAVLGAANLALFNFNETNIWPLQALINANNRHIALLNNSFMNHINSVAVDVLLPTGDTAYDFYDMIYEEAAQARVLYAAAVAAQKIWKEQGLVASYDGAVWTFAVNRVEFINNNIAICNEELSKLDKVLEALYAQKQALSASLDKALAALSAE